MLIPTSWSAVADYFAFDTALLADPVVVARLILQALLLCGMAFFSGSETALFSLSRLDLQKLRRQRHRNSETVHALLDQPRRLIISILCGNELMVIASGVNFTGLLVTFYGPDRAGVISVLVMLPLILLFGEVTPKTVAVSNPIRFGVGLAAGPLSLWVKLITPLRLLIRKVADRLTTWIVGEGTDPENILRVDEFRSLVEEVAKGGELNATERALIHNLLDAGDTEVVEIMTPRTRIQFINSNTPVPEILDRVRKIQHSRIPVFCTYRDNLVGFIHAEDVLRLVLDSMDLRLLSVDDLVHPPVVVPPTKKVDEMFEFFQKRQCRAAVVLNEFGGVEGFVTIKDVLNFVFGGIAGRPNYQELYRRHDQDDYEVPGDMKLVDFNNVTNFGLEDPRMTTIAGVAFRHLDGLPKVGDVVVHDDLELTVLGMDAHRISRLRVRRISHTDDSEGRHTDGDVRDEEAAIVTHSFLASDEEEMEEDAAAEMSHDAEETEHE